MVSQSRLTRIAERIREELSEIILLESSDPRLKGVTITDTKVDKELAYADIYVCTIEGIQRSDEVISGLQHAQGYLRSELAHRMQLRYFPRLKFHWDPTFENADRIEKLIISIHDSDNQNKNKAERKRVVKNEGA